MRFRFALCTALLAAGGVRAGDDYPRHTLKNDRIAFTVYLPDEKAGFYRGTRFDWSGVLGRVEFGGHKVFGPWKDTHNPANNDDILGPVEEFGMQAPLGYDEAKEGDTFLKIGVGELVKPKEEKYRFWNNYAIKHAGTWEVTKSGTDVEFKQALLTATGYGYRYTKKVVLEPAGFRIHHELTNTGTKPIDTDQYNHNFFNVDGDTVGPNYRFYFPAPINVPAPKERFAEVVGINGKGLKFTKPLDKGSVWAELEGLAGERGTITLRHAATGLSVQVTGDTPFEKVNFWGMATTICPEPFIRIRLKSGESKTWSYVYAFTIGK